MQLVYFLFLPFALLSNHLLSFAECEPTSSEYAVLAVDWHVLLKMFLVIACFGLLRNRESLMLWLWCPLQPICLVASGWTQWTQGITTASGSQACSIAMFLAPSVALLLLMEIIRCSRIRQTRRIGSSWNQNLAYCRKEMSRTIANTWLFPILLPLGMAGLADLGALTNIAGLNQGLFGAIVFTITTSAIVTILIPHLFTRLIGAGPIDESIAVAVERTWRTGSASVPRILQWPTGCRMANAAVVGLFGYGRKLLLTDALLQRLNDRELSMVVLHELAHCIRFHAWIRMLPTFAAVGMLLGAMTFLSGVWLSLSCVAIIGLFVASLIAICWWSEFDADRVAVDLAVRSGSGEPGSGEPGNGEPGNGASREMLMSMHVWELCEALSKIYGSRNMERSSWMHPSCVQRIAAIRRHRSHRLH